MTVAKPSEEQRPTPVETHIALLLQSVGQVAVGIWEVWLELDGPAVRVNGQVNETLLIVHTCQVAMDHRMVGAKA